jgi:hypothetical protein
MQQVVARIEHKELAAENPVVKVRKLAERSP